ncbi:MAG: PD-(D/E)XK nuclease family protein [Rhizobiales bacterium]|nr:PD-(D/E)XK nuclease family protein [Hyphomicrobiales bacterium]
MQRHSVIVEGPLAFRMRRLRAARESDHGLQILTLPLLAARLAGGFCRPAARQELDPAIRAALAAGGLADLEGIRELPGMTRAVGRTLASLWDADIDPATFADRSPRLADIALLDVRVRAALPPGVLAPPDLRRAALARVSHAPSVIGATELDRLGFIPPVWRSLLGSLAAVIPVRWHNPSVTDAAWFPGETTHNPAPVPAVPESVCCADPRAEAVEALRWARHLLSSGRARPEDIAITATATTVWDDHFLALSESAELPLHFSHGVPALSLRPGQECAALADALVGGLSQDRIRRLFAHAAGAARALRDLPRNWAAGLPPEAGLFEFDHWRVALDRAAAERLDGLDPRPQVLPVLELIVRGPEAAAEAGERLLPAGAIAFWQEALRRAPAGALEYALRDLRVADGKDPGACVVWCPAAHLAGAPRPWVRLIGMTSRGWPRRGGDDPLLPAHVLDPHLLDPDPVTERDRRAFRVIRAAANGGCVLSRSTRSAQGTMQAPAALLPREPAAVLKRGRIPLHAFSESDRLLARPQEARALPYVASAAACWRSRRVPDIGAHDGVVRAAHPALASALGRTHSATSLRLLLRDPLGFSWRYALGWRAAVGEEQPLTIDARIFGELVHELLRIAVDLLEPDPGYLRAARHEIEEALARAADAVTAAWPLERATPPPLLWRHTVDKAAALGLRALVQEESFRPGTRSWTEVPFGDPDSERDTATLPWDPRAEVIVGETGIRLLGNIDRLDLNTNGDIRVSDYKTGAVPKKPDSLVLGGGAELQRAIYALAARCLLPGERRIAARLLFLRGEDPKPLRLQDSRVDDAIAQLCRVVETGIAALKDGKTLPGPDAKEPWNDLRLALPAAPGVYFRVKQGALARAQADLARVWSAP